MPDVVTFVLATPGRAERSRQFTAEDLREIAVALQYASGGSQDQATKDRWRSLAHRLRGASAAVRDGGESAPRGGYCYACGQRV